MLDIFNKKPKGQMVTLSINGMHCTSCAMNIDGALEDSEGVLSAETSYAKASVKVQYDPNKITEDQIKKIIVNEGYDVV